MFFLWPGMVSCASVPRGIATSIFHFNSVALSESSLGHRFQSSPKCKAEAFCSTLRVAPSRLTWVSGSRAYSGYFECCLSNGIPGGSVVKNPPATQKTWVRSLGWKIPWRRNWEPTPVFSLGKSHGEKSLAGYSPWGRKELDTTKQLTFSHFQSIKLAMNSLFLF